MTQRKVEVDAQRMVTIVPVPSPYWRSLSWLPPTPVTDGGHTGTTVFNGIVYACARTMCARLRFS